MAMSIKRLLAVAGLAALIVLSACTASESNGRGVTDGGQGASGGSGGRNDDSGVDAGQDLNATGGAGGSGGGADASDAPLDVGGDEPGDSSSNSGSNSDAAALEVISGTADGGPYSRTGWTAQSMPPFPTGTKALNMDLKYGNALDGNFNTRWSIGSTNAPAQTIGDQFTFDMLTPHVFKKVLFWAGGMNGVNGPDPRDYPGALDLATSNDCVTFGPTVASGNEPQPGCGGATACSMPFVIALPAPATARCVRLTLTKGLQVGGPIWWAISELFVYP
jgi:hypothetical protein